MFVCDVIFLFFRLHFSLFSTRVLSSRLFRRGMFANLELGVLFVSFWFINNLVFSHDINIISFMSFQNFGVAVV